VPDKRTRALASLSRQRDRPSLEFVIEPSQAIPDEARIELALRETSRRNLRDLSDHAVHLFHSL
jgi:hypothetical protein